MKYFKFFQFLWKLRKIYSSVIQSFYVSHKINQFILFKCNSMLSQKEKSRTFQKKKKNVWRRRNSPMLFRNGAFVKCSTVNSKRRNGRYHILLFNKYSISQHFLNKILKEKYIFCFNSINSQYEYFGNKAISILTAMLGFKNTWCWPLEMLFVFF